MDARGKLLLTWISLTIIVALSLLVAYVTFGLLESSAEADIQGYKLGGAIAAFAFYWRTPNVSVFERLPTPRS